MFGTNGFSNHGVSSPDSADANACAVVAESEEFLFVARDDLVNLFDRDRLSRRVCVLHQHFDVQKSLVIELHAN